MPLPQRSQSRSVRVPRFLRGGEVVRPARFGNPPPEVIPAPEVAPASNAIAPLAPEVPVVTMPLAPTEVAGAEALPEELLENAVDADGLAGLPSGDDDSNALPPAMDASEDAAANPVADDANENESAADAGSAPAEEAPASPAPPIDDALLAEIGTAIAEVGEGARRDALALGLSLARRLVGLYIEADEEALRLLIENAFERLSAATTLDVAVHPEDLSFFETPPSDRADIEDTGAMAADEGDANETAPEGEMAAETHASPPRPLPAPGRPGANVRLVADASLARGEVRVTSDVGDIDATLDARIAVARAVLEELE